MREPIVWHGIPIYQIMHGTRNLSLSVLRNYRLVEAVHGEVFCESSRTKSKKSERAKGMKEFVCGRRSSDVRRNIMDPKSGKGEH